MTSLRNILALGALALAFTACGPGTSPAVGKWNIDLDSTVAAAQKAMNEQMASMPDEQKKMMEGMMKPMLDALKEMQAVMDIKEDGSFVIDASMPGEEKSKITGTWTLEGDTITLVGKEEGKEEQTVVGTVKGDTISCEMGEGEQTITMVFNRQK